MAKMPKRINYRQRYGKTQRPVRAPRTMELGCDRDTDRTVDSPKAIKQRQTRATKELKANLLKQQNRCCAGCGRKQAPIRPLDLWPSQHLAQPIAMLCHPCALILTLVPSSVWMSRLLDIRRKAEGYTSVTPAPSQSETRKQIEDRTCGIIKDDDLLDLDHEADHVYV